MISYHALRVLELAAIREIADLNSEAKFLGFFSRAENYTYRGGRWLGLVVVCHGVVVAGAGLAIAGGGGGGRIWSRGKGL